MLSNQKHELVTVSAPDVNTSVAPTRESLGRDSNPEARPAAINPLAWTGHNTFTNRNHPKHHSVWHVPIVLPSNITNGSNGVFVSVGFFIAKSSPHTRSTGALCGHPLVGTFKFKRMISPQRLCSDPVPIATIPTHIAAAKTVTTFSRRASAKLSRVTDISNPHNHAMQPRAHCTSFEGVNY